MNILKNTVVIIGGATGCGKSALALEIANAFDGVIINGDSLQLYKELRILTARPGDADLKKAPHRLYGILTGDQESSVALWQKRALEEIGNCLEKDLLPIVVGGTGLYLRALMEGLSPVPEISPEIRKHLRQRTELEGIAPLYEELRRVDPQVADLLKPKDSARILRALEVFKSTGKSLNEWKKAEKKTPLDARFISFALLPDRTELYAFAEKRFEEMLQIGAVEEVKSLLALGYAPSSSLMKALGVREIQAYLEGKISFENMLVLGKTATRQYIKRQYTWFSRQLEDKIILPHFYDQKTFRKVKKQIDSLRA